MLSLVLIIKLNNSWDKVVRSHQVWGNDVHMCFKSLLFQPLHHAWQTSPYDAWKVAIKAKDVLEYAGILWECQVQATYKEICR